MYVGKQSILLGIRRCCLVTHLSECRSTSCQQYVLIFKNCPDPLCGLTTMNRALSFLPPRPPSFLPSLLLVCCVTAKHCCLHPTDFHQNCMHHLVSFPARQYVVRKKRKKGGLDAYDDSMFDLVHQKYFLTQK